MVQDQLEERLGWERIGRLKGLKEGTQHQLLQRALSSLPKRQHEAITLRLLEGRSPGEVAEIMGIEKATVRSNIRHGKRQLRKIVAEMGTGASVEG